MASQASFYFEKQPAEKLTIGVDFDNALGTGESISSASVTAIDLSDGSDASSTILDGAYSIDGSVIAQKVKAGDDDKQYKITIKTTTDAPHIFEADITMTVREL